MNNLWTFSILLIPINLLILFNTKKLSKIIKILDIPDQKRKIHKEPTPLFGGILYYFNFLLFIIFFSINDITLLFETFFITENKPLFYFLVLISLIFIIGLYDDKYGLRATSRLLTISLIIILYLKIDNTAVLNEINFSFTSTEIGIDIGSIPFSYLCLLVLLISCNMFDGINLQSFVFFFVNFIFLFCISQNYFILLSLFSIVIFGILNYKGKIFLGDSGVYFISIILGIFYIKYYNFGVGKITSDVVFSMLFLPVLDATRCILTRIFMGQNPLVGDQRHLHHLLIKKFSFSISLLIISFLILIPPAFFLLRLDALYSIFIVIILYSILFYLCLKK